MLSIGQAVPEQRQFESLLSSSHRLFTRVSILDLNHKYLSDISEKLLDGVVSVDAEGDPATRNVQADFLDPRSSMRLDTGDPDDSALFMDRMFKITQTLITPTGQLWFDVPVFCGPLTKVQRRGFTLSVEGQGKEIMGAANSWQRHTFAKGLLKSTVITRIMQDILGETKLDIIERPEKLPDNLAITPDKSPWKVASQLANSMNCQLFYDGRGVCRMRETPSKSVFTFESDVNILSDPQMDYDASELKNAIIVLGGKPKGSKERIVVRLVADRKHPLSPWNIGRKDAPRYLTEIIEDDSIKTKAEAMAIAKRKLKLNLIQAMQTSFDALPPRHLDPLDLCRISTDKYSATFRLRQFTIPLTVSNPSSIGYLKRGKPLKKAIRRNKR
jgi:hypothetical protein